MHAALEAKELNDLESRFFNEILNAGLDVPVPATLQYEGTSIEMVVVPEITAAGHFGLRYYNASTYQPKRDTDGTISMSDREDLGEHPLLTKSWHSRDRAELELRPSPLPMRDQVTPELDVRVLFANYGHRGELVLYKDQIALGNSPRLKTAEFCISGFRNFAIPVEQLIQIADPNALSDGAKPLRFSPKRIMLDSGDGWTITLTKERGLLRDSICHTGVVKKGVVKKNDGDEFSDLELRNVLEALKYFFAFVMGVYCSPTVAIGYDVNGLPAWGEIGKFETIRQRPSNWFNHASAAPSGKYLEYIFPKFWSKWQEYRNEITAIIDCYVRSAVMQRSGLLEDAVAKSCSGLEILADLVRKDSKGRAGDKISEVLHRYEIPHRDLEQSQTPVTYKLNQDITGKTDTDGAKLIANVRNYVAHPLDSDSIAIKAEHHEHLDSNLMQYVYVHDLSQFYLEYTLLRFCGCQPEGHRQLLETSRKLPQ